MKKGAEPLILAMMIIIIIIKTPKRTTLGWKLQAECKYLSMQRLYLKDMKASYPLELAEYVVTNKVNQDREFNCWVKDVLRARD